MTRGMHGRLLALAALTLAVPALSNGTPDDTAGVTQLVAVSDDGGHLIVAESGEGWGWFDSVLLYETGADEPLERLDFVSGLNDGGPQFLLDAVREKLAGRFELVAPPAPSLVSPDGRHRIEFRLHRRRNEQGEPQFRVFVVLSGPHGARTLLHRSIARGCPAEDLASFDLQPYWLGEDVVVLTGSILRACRHQVRDNDPFWLVAQRPASGDAWTTAERVDALTDDGNRAADAGLAAYAERCRAEALRLEGPAREGERLGPLVGDGDTSPHTERRGPPP
jgi:hypothetical protein